MSNYFTEKDTQELKEHLQEKENELQLLMEEKVDLEKNLALLPDLKQQLKQKEEEVENLLKITSVVGEEAHQNEIEKLKGELKTMEGEIAKHVKEKEELENASKEIEEFKRKLRNKDVEVVNLTLEKEEMMTSLDELDNQHQEAMSQIIKVRDSLSKTNEELKIKLRTSESELQKARSEFDSFKQQHIVNQSVESSDSNELNHQIAELKEENNELRQKVNNCDTTILELTEDIMLKESEIEDMKVKMSGSATALNDLHMDKQELESCNTKLKEELSSKVHEIKRLKENIETSVKTDALVVERREVVDDVVEAEHSAPLLSRADSETHVTIHQLKNELKMVETQLDEAKSELSQKTSECVHLQSDYQALNNDLESVQKSKDSLLTEYESLNSVIKTKDSEHESLKVSINEKTEEIAKLKEDLIHVQNDREKLQEDTRRKTDECESFSRQIHSLEAHISSLQDKNKDIEAVFKSETEKVKNLTKQLTELKTECTAQEEQYQEEVKTLQDKINDIDAEKQSKLNEIEELIRLKETLNSELSVLKEVIKEKDLNCDRLNSQILNTSNELAIAREELNEKSSEIVSMKDELNSEKQELVKTHEKETEWLKSQIGVIKKEKEDLQDIFDKDICDLKEEHESQLNKIQETNKELTQANKDLSRDLAGLETQYQAYIETLKANNDTDHSSLESRYNQVLEDAHKKDLQISSQETQISSLEEQLKGYKEKVDNLELWKRETSEILNSKEKEICDIKANLLEAQEDKQKLERDILKIKEEYGNERTLQIANIDKLKSQLETMSDYESLKQNLNESSQASEEQVKILEGKIESLEAEIEIYKQTIKDHEFGIAELNKEKLELQEHIEKEKGKWVADEGMLHVLKQTNTEKEIEIHNLQRQLHRAKSFVDEDQQKAIENEIIAPNYDLPAIEYKEKGEIELQEVCETVQPVQSAPLSMVDQGDLLVEEAEKHKVDVTREIDTLKNQLNEKDNVISELQRNNTSLLKMLDTKSKGSGDVNLVEMHRLENETIALKREREQMMDVMNEKTKEVSSLKAEVHRLMEIASAEKLAIEKLQKDSQEMSRNVTVAGENHTDDMQKEAIQNLSRMIRDKDLEVESLKQKNETLLSVLQESSQAGNQINSLMAERDNLTKQLTALQTEREQMIAYLNQKHQESVAYHNEVQRLTAVINAEMAKNSQIAIEYEKLIPQFEDKTQALLKAQNELMNYKQKYTELEMKYGQLLQQSNIDESVDKATFNSKTEELTRLQERYKELVDSVKEKEMKIQNLHQSINELEQNFRSADHEKGSYKKQVDNFVFQLQGLQNEQKDLKTEIEHLKAQKTGLISENKSLKELNNKLTLQMQDRDFEIKSLQEKTTTLTAFLQERQGDQSQLDNLMRENESTQHHIKQIQQERDQALIALQQKQNEADQLHKEV